MLLVAILRVKYIKFTLKIQVHFTVIMNRESRMFETQVNLGQAIYNEYTVV